MEISETLIALLQLEGVGRSKAEWVCRHSSPADLQAGLGELNRRGLLPATLTEAALDRAAQAAAGILAVCRTQSWSVLTLFDPDFPEQLHHIPDVPVLLYRQGNSARLSVFPRVAVIGSRAPGARTRQIARQLGAELAKQGAAVISGLALGCDTAAHEGCLEQGGFTAAVLPSGLDRPYPPENLALAGRVAREGCLLSEYPPGTEPARYRFVERDRLQSGLSDLVVVVETEVDGGTMHTARFAKRQGRRLLVFSPDSLDGDLVRSAGNRKLLADGRAEAVESVDEVLVAVKTMTPPRADNGRLF